ncbi:hypothetical protein Q5M85_09135 [Paraclostridium bifermentans]|nr:hypothetical protein [Paraclostridium bifermentans]
MDNLNIIKCNENNMIIKVDNINAHPFNEFDLFIKQIDKREEIIKSILKSMKQLNLYLLIMIMF